MLLLLDIDGVMVHASPWKKIDSLEDGFYDFMPRAVDGLRKIISETGASIVLTTSHKSTFSLAEWKNIFKKRGIDTNVSKLEDNLDYLSRKDEILRWKNNNADCEDYVILDDDKSLHDLPQNIKERVVFTQSYVGLKSENVENAIQLFKNPVLVY